MAACRRSLRTPPDGVLGIDEHFFSRKEGYATTLCDLGHNRIYDVVLGRTEASLERYLARLTGKDKVEVACMDLSATYRFVARKHFLNARDRRRPLSRYPPGEPPFSRLLEAESTRSKP